MALISYSGYRFPRDVIQRAVWMYLRFTLSLRDVEDLLAERGIVVSYETIRRWVGSFGPAIARGAAGGAPRAASTMAPGRDVRPDRRQTDIPLESRRCRG